MNNCNEKDCNFKSNLKKHLWEVHSIGKGQIYNCNEKDCNVGKKK